MLLAGQGKQLHRCTKSIEELDESVDKLQPKTGRLYSTHKWLANY